MTSPGPAQTEHRAGGTAPHTVLVVEDDPEVRELAVQWLREAGHAVLEAGTGACAMALFDKHPEIGLLFTDIVMPGVDGIWVAATAKRRRPDVQVVYTTGYSRAMERGSALHGEILHKPYRGRELLAAVARALA